MKKQLVTILITFFISTELIAQYPIGDLKLFESTLLLQLKNDNGKYSSGSGFMIRDYFYNQEYVYLITAKHVLGDSDKSGNFILKDEILNFYYHGDIYSEKLVGVSLNLKNLWEKNHLIINSKSDVAVCLVGVVINGKFSFYGITEREEILKDDEVTLITIPNDYLTPMKNVKIGNDVLVVGYPTAVGIEENSQIDFKKPLVKEGIVSGINSKTNTIILDCELYGGNSGGPIFSYYPEIEKTKLIGVVIQYISVVSNNVITNSGYSVGAPIEKVEEILKVFRKKMKEEMSVEERRKSKNK